jgi:outer membrane lipoprotein-sorting protein
MSKSSARRAAFSLTALVLASVVLSGCGIASAVGNGVSQTVTAATTAVTSTASAAGNAVGIGNAPVTDRGGLNRYNPYTGQWNN